MLKVLVADNHPLFREAVILAVRHLDGTDSQIFEAGTLDETERLAAAIPDLDLLLLDLKLPGTRGLSGLLELRRRFPDLPVVIISATEKPRVIRETIAAGAMAYIPKSLGRASIAEALTHVLVGDTWQPGDRKAQHHREGGPSPSGKTLPLTQEPLARKVPRIPQAGNQAITASVSRRCCMDAARIWLHQELSKNDVFKESQANAKGLRYPQQRPRSALDSRTGTT